MMHGIMSLKFLCMSLCFQQTWRTVDISNGNIVSAVRLIWGWNKKKIYIQNPIIRSSEQVEISYTFDKALVFGWLDLWLDAYAQKERGCGSSINP